MRRTPCRVLERGPGGYHTRRPANYDLTTGRAFDGRAVGMSACGGSGMFAAVLPDPLRRQSDGGMPARLHGGLVTVILLEDYCEGTPDEIAQALREYAGRLDAEAADLPAAEAALREVEAAGRGLAGFAAEGHHMHAVVPALRRCAAARDAAALAPLAREAAERVARLVLPVGGLVADCGPRRPPNAGEREGVLLD